MPNRQSVSVIVVVNFNGVSYNASTGQWSGAPTWTVPPTQQVQSGENTITWSLQAAAVPRGFNAAFTNGGIVFDPNDNWVGTTPVIASPTSVTCNDDFTIPAGDDPEDYEYSVFVSLTSANDPSITNTWSYDPDVENEPIIQHTPEPAR